MPPQAVTAAEVRTEIEDLGSISIPPNVSDGDLDTKIERHTAVVLSQRGADTLPDADTVERRLVEQAVLQRVKTELMRDFAPDNADLQDALNKREASLTMASSDEESEDQDADKRFHGTITGA